MLPYEVGASSLACIYQNSQQIRNTKEIYQNFQFFQPLIITSCVPVIFSDMNNYIFKSFRTFCKQNYAIALGNCCLFTKKTVEHGIEHDIDSGYRVFMY